MQDQEKIPERHIEFCKKLTQLAKEHGCIKFSFEYTPGSFLPNGQLLTNEIWHGEIKGHWYSGRHGAPATLSIESVSRAHAEV